MTSHCYVMNINRNVNQNMNVIQNNAVPPIDKVMSYEEKSVGSTPFFKCEACPYMALAEDDIKFHLFTAHPELAKSNGLADNIQIPCPGCSGVFDAEETLRTHLRSHHKMGIKDIKKMVRSLVQIALKDAKLKKGDRCNDVHPLVPMRQDVNDVKIPQVIEIVPDVVNANSHLPKGVAFISVDELNRMSTPNFEQVDPKEIIEEASINIVYSNEVPSQYLMPDSTASNTPYNVIQVSSVTPDLISSIQPRVSTSMDSSIGSTTQSKESVDLVTHNPPHILRPEELNQEPIIQPEETEKKLGRLCSVNGCHIRLKEDQNLVYHRKCHRNQRLICPECSKGFRTSEALHVHLWKVHEIDLELPTCEICGYKTYKKYRLYSIHMKCHSNIAAYYCSICSKSFKNSSQLSKHKQIHKKDSAPVKCPICHLEFASEKRLKVHDNEVHKKLRPYKCTHCEYTAARKEELKVHLRGHTGDKPYSCDQCSYRSGDHNSMRRHKLQHSKESTYKCKHCPYTTIQSTVFAKHMISKHSTADCSDIHQCPYCTFKSVNRQKYITHLTKHTEKEGVQLLIEMTKEKNKPSWNIPSEEEKSPTKTLPEQDQEASPKTVNNIPIEVYDCDSLSESMPQDYSKSFCAASSSEAPQPDYNDQVSVTDLSKDDNHSDCLLSESSTETIIQRHQFTPQHPLQMPYDSTQSNLHDFLIPTVSLNENLLQSSNVNSLASSHCAIGSSMPNSILNNFPIRLPPVPRISHNNIMLTPLDRISLPMNKVTGPIITPTQILPVPSSSNSPVNIPEDGVPRKKPKISVKSNLILKGPDQVNMFHSQQKMAFRRLEDNERFGLGGPVTFNNLITTQFMQLQPEPALSESPSDIMPYPQETMMGDAATTPVDNELNASPQIFTFNPQMPVGTMLPPPQKIQTNDPSYIKIEATIKQTQSPSLERMCNANLLTSATMSREYKASPPLEDIHKNMSEIKNEVKSDAFYNMTTNNVTNPNPPMIDQYLMDNIYMDLSGVVLQEITEQQNEVIEIDDNSDDNKLLPRYDMNFPLESLYLMHNDFHFLDNDVSSNNIPNETVNEMNRMATDVPMMNQKENGDPPPENASDFPNFIQGKKDPMMNTSVRPTTNKINVKNIELMKN